MSARALQFTMLRNGRPSDETSTDLDRLTAGRTGRATPAVRAVARQREGLVEQAARIARKFRPQAIAPPAPEPVVETSDPVLVDATLTRFEKAPVKAFTPVAETQPLATADHVGSKPMIGPQPEAAPTAPVPELSATDGQRNFIFVAGLVIAVVGVGVAIWSATRGS